MHKSRKSFFYFLGLLCLFVAVPILATSSLIPPTGKSRRSLPRQLYEHACHEGNYGLFGILGGARADEREALK